MLDSLAGTAAKIKEWWWAVEDCNVEGNEQKSLMGWDFMLEVCREEGKRMIWKPLWEGIHLRQVYEGR